MPSHSKPRPLAQTAAVALATLIVSWLLASIAVLRCEAPDVEGAACSLNYDDDQAALGLIVFLAPTVLASIVSWTRPRRWWLAPGIGMVLAVVEFAIVWPR